MISPLFYLANEDGIKVIFVIIIIIIIVVVIFLNYIT